MTISTRKDGIYAEISRHPLLLSREIKMIKYGLRLWKLEDNRFAEKEPKVLINDDVKGHYN